MKWLTPEEIELFENAKKQRGETTTISESDVAMLALSHMPKTAPQVGVRSDADEAILKKYGLSDAVSTPQKAKLGFWELRKLNKNPTTSYLVTMLYNNASTANFIISTSQAYFSDLNKKKYHIDKDRVWFDTNDKISRLFYQEDFFEPINHEIKTEGEEQYLSVTPQNVENLIKQEFIKNITNLDITTWVKVTLLGVVIAILGIGVTIILGVQTSRIMSGIIK
jgi:hypothetical protein